MPPVPTSVDGMERKTLVQKEQDAGREWTAGPPGGALQRTIFNILCVASFGHVGLSPVWASIRLYHKGDDSVWVEETRQLCDRLNNFLLVGPYICMLCACGLFIGSIIVTAVAFLVLSKAGPIWSQCVLYSTRFHVYSTLIMLSYPLISIGAGTALLGVGILGAMWVLCPPFAMGVLFSISYLSARLKIPVP
ncbi:hypothetical protein DFH08DRAFT_887366 [Mycena albidolilacea]|uniref:Uncharacterized protein n=1 Tax=Mycena albidolilacea TaxID=1033008 RepID=A0AAD6ZHT8_9AGAR|nr:hypothetical protein DFH08DRAFT_887366 [Mycena albidolilacea]